MKNVSTTIELCFIMSDLKSLKFNHCCVKKDTSDALYTCQSLISFICHVCKTLFANCDVILILLFKHTWYISCNLKFLENRERRPIPSRNGTRRRLAMASGTAAARNQLHAAPRRGHSGLPTWNNTLAFLLFNDVLSSGAYPSSFPKPGLQCKLGTERKAGDALT